jgi:hypothetical protein
MDGELTHPVGPDAEADWHKNSKLVRKGYKDLAYLPRGRSAWNMTLSAVAFSARRHVGGAASADLNLWAAMHGCPPSARYEELGAERLALWHGTSAVRAGKIRDHGLAHKRGVWAATDPRIAHGYTRGRSRAFQAGSAMVVVVINKVEWAGRADREHAEIARFHESIPPECVEYILWSDRIEFCGERKARGPKPWGKAHLKKDGRRWVPRSRPPVRLDGQRSYSDLDEWLELSVRRILATLGTVAAIEVFSSLYATIDPWRALEHRQVFDALERLCGEGRVGPRGMRRFSLRE